MRILLLAQVAGTCTVPEAESKFGPIRLHSPGEPWHRSCGKTYRSISTILRHHKFCASERIEMVRWEPTGQRAWPTISAEKNPQNLFYRSFLQARLKAARPLLRNYEPTLDSHGCLPRVHHRKLRMKGLNTSANKTSHRGSKPMDWQPKRRRHLPEPCGKQSNFEPMLHHAVW